MLFHSWNFVAFLVVVLLGAAFLPRYGRAWKVFIVLASCYFYAQWNWKYLGLIALTATVDYCLAKRIPASTRPRTLVTASICANLGVLALFKYTNFVIATANGMAEAAKLELVLQPFEILLPVGISFYTFQNMSYTIDVYRRQLQPRASPLDYAVFTTFFPQLLAGPIVRASEFFGQLDRPAPHVAKDLQYGLVLILAGYFKKMVLADNLAPGVDEVFANAAAASPWAALLAVYAFAFQIYFDFSGYTDIAIGIALLFGFRFPRNFDHPYVALSLQEFWRRWHMTLSRWLRDYLYIPLGGNRRGERRMLANLMVTMVLGGLWHGASWNFVIWGALHGLYLVIERAWRKLRPEPRAESRSAKVLRWLVVFHAVCFAWIFFRAPGLDAAAAIIGRIIRAPVTPIPFEQVGGLASLLAIVVLAHFAADRLDLKQRLSEARALTFAAWAAAILVGIALLSPSKMAPFIYFQF